MASINEKQHQKERGLSVNQEKIRPKLTTEQRKSMTVEEKKAYNAERLKEYRNEYISLYSKEVVSKSRAIAKQEKKEALIFYKKYKEEQQAKLSLISV